MAASQETVNTLRPQENSRYFGDNILKCISLNENYEMLIQISVQFVPKGPI